MSSDFSAIRRAIARLDSSSSASATGMDRPKVEDIFAPEHHIGALDPGTTVVLGSRGTGKSFWAGVLANDDTRAAAAEAYPNIGLENILARPGFTGQTGDGSVSRATIDAQVLQGTEKARSVLLWRCVVLRAVKMALAEKSDLRLAEMMTQYADPEEWEAAIGAADSALAVGGKRVVVLFDALDSLAEEWGRLRDLLDALLQVAWSIRGLKSVRAKLFLRPDQMQDLGLRFVELPKMMAGATRLVWTRANLYGMFFSRLSRDTLARVAFADMLEAHGLPAPPDQLSALRKWRLVQDEVAQARTFSLIAGVYMGRSNKKGRTYDWPINHLADGLGEVTPRSFLTLMQAAAVMPPEPDSQALTAEGIRSGLRQASRVRLDQLDTEFKWIKRVLAPLARLQVPCTAQMVIERWEENKTVTAVMKAAANLEFLPPFESLSGQPNDVQLIDRLVRMGVLTRRNDGRHDMPDLFRVAARLLKKGGVAPA